MGARKPLHVSCDVRIFVEEAGDAVVSFDASGLLDVGRAAGSAAHSVPRATVGRLGRLLPSVGSHIACRQPSPRPRRGSTEACRRDARIVRLIEELRPIVTELVARSSPIDGRLFVGPRGGRITTAPGLTARGLCECPLRRERAWGRFGGLPRCHRVVTDLPLRAAGFGGAGPTCWGSCCLNAASILLRSPSVGLVRSHVHDGARSGKPCQTGAESLPRTLS